MPAFLLLYNVNHSVLHYSALAAMENRKHLRQVHTHCMLTATDQQRVALWKIIQADVCSLVHSDTRAFQGATPTGKRPWELCKGTAAELLLKHFAILCNALFQW